MTREGERDGSRVATGVDRWHSIQEAADHFRIGRTLLYVLMNEGGLPYLPVGARGRRVKLGDVERALRQRVG